jgi:hypothetical protein
MNRIKTYSYHIVQIISYKSILVWIYKNTNLVEKLSDSLYLT